MRESKLENNYNSLHRKKELLKKQESGDLSFEENAELQGLIVFPEFPR